MGTWNLWGDFCCGFYPFFHFIQHKRSAAKVLFDDARSMVKNDEGSVPTPNRNPTP